MWRVASRPWHYLVGFGILMATGMSFGSLVPVMVTVTRWFHRYRGRAMAIPLGASGFAGFLGAPLLNSMLTANGGNWRQAWLVVAGIMVFSATAALLFVKERPENLGQEVDGGVSNDTARETRRASPLTTKFLWAPAEVYRTGAYWLIVVGGLACQFPFFFFTAHWILHLRQRGITAADAAWAMGLFTMGAIGGRL